MVPEKKSPNNPKLRIIQFQIIKVWLWYVCCDCILCINQPLHRKKDYQSHFLKVIIQQTKRKFINHIFKDKSKGYNLLDNLRWTVKINQALMDPHFEPVPSLGALSTGSLTCGNLQVFCWHSDWTLHSKLLVLSSTDQISTHLGIEEKV